MSTCATTFTKNATGWVLQLIFFNNNGMAHIRVIFTQGWSWHKFRQTATVSCCCCCCCCCCLLVFVVFFSISLKRVWQHLSWRYILQRVSRIENLIIKLFPRWHTDSSHQRFGNRHVSAEVTPFFSQSGKTKVTLSAKSSGCPRTNLQDPNMNYSWTTHKFCCLNVLIYLSIRFCFLVGAAVFLANILSFWSFLWSRCCSFHMSMLKT